MTGQTLLDTMELLNQELQLQSGEADVTRGLLALNVAQDFFEAAAAKRPEILSTDATLTQTQNQEYTTYPTGLLRLDALYYLDSNGKQVWKINPRRQSGDHRPSMTWWTTMLSTSSTGKPKAYWTNAAKIFWDPLPDAANSVRYYGLIAATDITVSGTFLYPDICRLPIATFACSVLKIGVDDDPAALSSLAQNLFEGILDEMANSNRDGARPLVYQYDHS